MLEHLCPADRVRVEVEQPPAPCHRGRQVAQISQLEVGLDEPGPWRELDDAVADGQRQHLAVRAVDDLLEARDQPGREERPQIDGVERLPVSQPQPEARMGVRGAAGPAAQLAGRAAEDLAHGVVELPDAAEPGGERHVGECQFGRLGQDPGRVRPARPSELQRTCPQLTGEDAVQLA